AAKPPLLYCPSEPRGDQNKISGSYSEGLTWYVAVVGLNYYDGFGSTYAGIPGAVNSLPDPSRSGILSFIDVVSSTSSGSTWSISHHGSKLSQVTDGLSNTVMIGERPPSPSLGIGLWFWWGFDVLIGSEETALVYPTSDHTSTGPTCPSPTYFGPGDNTNWCSTNHFWSWHTVGGNFAFGDGSVRFLPYSANQILVQLSTRAGGEVVDASQY